MCDRQHPAAAQSVSEGSAGNNRDDLKGVRVLYSVASWLVNREAYYVYFFIKKIISKMAELMLTFFLCKRDMTDDS